MLKNDRVMVITHCHMISSRTQVCCHGIYFNRLLTKKKKSDLQLCQLLSKNTTNDLSASKIEKRQKKRSITNAEVPIIARTLVSRTEKKICICRAVVCSLSSLRLLLDAECSQKNKRKKSEPRDFESPIFSSKSRNWYLPLEMPINPGHRFIILPP